MQLIEAALWVGILSGAVLASLWLWDTLGVAIASQGLIANTAALVFVISRQHGIDPISAMLAASLMGVVLGVLHFVLLKATNKEVLLVASVLLTFLWNDLWLSMPALTGGSGGLLLASEPLLSLLALGGAGLGCLALQRTLLPQTSVGFVGLTARQLGLQSGVLGVPVARLFGGGFALAGCVFGLLGAAGAQASGVVTPSLFATSWALTVLAVVVAPNIPTLHRALTLPVLFVALRWLLRDLVPPSIGTAQMVELAFPTAVLIWSRARLRSAPTME